MTDRAHALEARFRAAYEAARRAWPTVDLPVEVFVRHVAETSERPPSDAASADLYLACACARGDPSALGAFSVRYLALVGPAVKRIDASPAFAEEVAQALREALLVSRGGALPRIAAFRGRGTLAAWVRVAATRAALRMRSRERAAVDAAAPERMAPDLPADVAYLKRRYRPAFEAALRDALAALPARSRTLLRLHHVEGLSVDRIGAAYQVHRATAARWIASARGELVDGTRRRATARLGLEATEMESLMRLVASQLDVSLHQLAGEEL